MTAKEHQLSEGTESPHDLVVPSTDVVAAVRHGSVPSLAPPSLADQLVVAVAAGRSDWRLRDDVDESMFDQFVAWRSSWEHSWRLESQTSVRRLHRLALDLADTPRGLRNAEMIKVLDLGHGDVEIAPALHARVLSMVTSLRERVARLDGSAFGFVDATPGGRRPGLARTWDPIDGIEILAADASMTAAMHPDLGLVVTGRPSGSGDSAIVGVEEFQLLDGLTVVTAGRSTARFPIEDSRPLLWLVPGSIRWRIRRIPLAVAWARTLAGLEDSARFATTLHESVVLSSVHPVAAHRRAPLGLE